MAAHVQGGVSLERQKLIRNVDFWVGHMATACRFGVLALIGAAAAAPAVASEKWDMPTAYPEANFQTVNAKDFARCVESGTSGDITITVHSNGSLFKGNDIKRAVQTGQTQIGERLLSSHENENPIFGTDSIPFLATSYEDSVRLYQAAAPQLSELLAQQGLVLLYSVPWPPQGLYFAKDINSVADMKGVRIRSYNKSTAKLAELTGMAPVSIEAAEISQALSAGVIQSLITSAVTGQDSKVWEQLDHFYEVKAWMPRNYVIANKAAFEALADKNKAALKDCATKAETTGLQKSREANEAALATLAKNGMRVLKPNDQLASELRKVGDTITANWAATAGEAGKAVLDAYKK
jgi:TRAP-type C4-dicarboxylate transport system substrate-binding protein